jgi:S1-C subfamily serine protease
VNLVDVVIVVALVAAGITGFASGFTVQVSTMIAMFGGLWAGVWLAPSVADQASSPASRSLLILALLVGCTAAGGALGAMVGQRLAAGFGRGRLRRVDQSAGVVVSAVGVLVFTWVFAGTFASSPNSEASRAIQQSAIVRRLDAVLPPLPEATARLARLLDPLGFPQVFAGLEPTPAEPVPPPAPAELQAALAAAGPSTVKVLAQGCGNAEGSGFVVGPDLVMTNAHVVAGAAVTTTDDGDGPREAAVVLFDPMADVAVLRTSDLDGPVLPLADREAARGQGGAVLGYPEDGPLVIGPAAVRSTLLATGRDIYGEALVTRRVYELQAEVRPGNSGGPFVLPDGTVSGMVFARSISDGAVGYALTAEEIRPAIEAAAVRSQPVDTGPCVAG